MQVITRAAIAALALAATAAPALAFRGGGIPPCQQAVTDVPWGTVDNSCVGGPPGPGGWNGGVGGPGMRISRQGHKNWPNFHAPVAGSGYVARGPATAPAGPLAR